MLAASCSGRNSLARACRTQYTSRPWVASRRCANLPVASAGSPYAEFCAAERDPDLDPFGGIVFRQARAGIVEERFTDAARSQFSENAVELLCGETKGRRMGAVVTQTDHAIVHVRKIGPLALQALVQLLGVV